MHLYFLEDNGKSTTIWQPNKTLHRLDGPAKIKTNGDRFWYQNGLYHREDGPAVELADGRKYWYYKGKWLYHIISQEQYEQWLRLKAFW